MKTKLTFFLALFITMITFAQNGINYKAVIKDDLGNVVANDLVEVQFQILQGAGMTNVYQENHTPTTDANGIVIINIGEGTTSDVFADVDWASDDHYLNVQINTGSGLTDMGTTQFMAVPYSINALTSSDNYWSKDGNNVYNLNNNFGIGMSNPLARLDVKSPDGVAVLGDGELGVYGFSSAANIGGIGVKGKASGNYGIGVKGEAIATYGAGLYGISDSATGYGIYAANTSTTGLAYGVYSNSTTSPEAIAVYGKGNLGVYGFSPVVSTGGIGVKGKASGNYGIGVKGEAIATYGSGLYGISDSATGYGIYATNTSTTGYAGYFSGKMYIGGVSQIPSVRLHITGGSDAGLNQTGGYIVNGETTDMHMVIDNNEIMVKQNNVGQTLYLNHGGGDVSVGGSVVHSSDRRLKKDIETIPYGLEDVLKLQPKAYNWKNRDQTTKSLGLIAQDVQPIINNIVQVKNDADKTLSISYTELIPVLIKAIQEQQEIIDKQNSNIKSLTAELVETKDKQNSDYKILLKRVEQLEANNNQ